MRETAAPVDSQQTVGQFFEHILADWRSIAISTICALLLGLIYNHFSTRLYHIELKVREVDTAEEDNLGGLGGALGFLGAGGQRDADFSLYIEGLTSLQIATGLAGDAGLMQRVFDTQWNADIQQWEQPKSILNPVKRVFKAAIGAYGERWAPPDAEDLHEFLEEEIRTELDRESGILTVSMRLRSPELAADILRRVHAATDDMVRQKAYVRATAYVEYLAQQIERQPVAEFRERVAREILLHERKRMVANSGLDYAAEPLEPPTYSSRPVHPNALLTLVLAVLLGLLVGVMLAYLRITRALTQASEERAMRGPGPDIGTP